jgi:hypothetical protein
MIVGRSVRTTEEVVTQTKEATVNAGLVVKENKTKYLKISRCVINLQQDLIMDLHIFEGVRNFRYLFTLTNARG